MQTVQPFVCQVPVPKTVQELDAVVQYFQGHDLYGEELICYWQAIRDASLAQLDSAEEKDSVPGTDSY